MAHMASLLIDGKFCVRIQGVAHGERVSRKDTMLVSILVLWLRYA